MTSGAAASERRAPSFTATAARSEGRPATPAAARRPARVPALAVDTALQAKPRNGQPHWFGSLVSALLHLAVLALLLWLPPFQHTGNGPAADEAAITIDFIPLGEGQGQEAPQAGKHAAEAATTTGAQPTGPELAAPSDKGSAAAAAAPTSTDEARPEPTPTEPQSPTQQPNENKSTQEALNEQPRAQPMTEVPPQEDRPLAAEKAPETQEPAPAKPSSDVPPPEEKKITEAPAQPKETPQPRASAPPPPSPAQPETDNLPPASKIIEAPKADVVHLPPKSAFKPGSLGDIKPSEILGRQAGLAGEAGGTGSAVQAGGGIGTPGPLGGGTPTERHISELQARIDRMLLVYEPDYPDVVMLQRQVDKLFAEEGPLRPEELADAQRQMQACWQRARTNLGLPARSVDLTLALGRDGSIRDAKVGDGTIRKMLPAKRLADAIRACGPLSLPSERYLLWQTLTLRVGGN